MPAPRTTTSYAILGLLSVRRWTTYELAKQVQRSLNWFWPRAERKLYDEPKRLVADGLATATREQTGKRPRTVYAITAEGRAELGRWLGEGPAPRTSEFEGMVKVFFADAGTLAQLQENLVRIERDAADRLARLGAMAAGGPGEFPQRLHLSAIGLQLQAEQEGAVLRWARWAQEQVAHWVDSGDPGGWDAAGVLDHLARRVAAEIGHRGD